MVDFAHALVGARRRRRHLQLSLYRAGTADSGSRAGARGRAIARSSTPSAPSVETRATRALHRRQVDGRPHRDAGRPPRIRSCRSPAWCCSAIRCIRPASRPSGRDKHLPAIARPMLFVQGTRDAFGTPDELAPILGAAAAAADAARRRAAATIRSSCRERIRRRRPRSTPDVQRVDRRHSYTFSSMTSPPCEKPWRR